MIGYRTFRRRSSEPQKARDWSEQLNAWKTELAQVEIEVNNTVDSLGAFWEPMGII